MTAPFLAAYERYSGSNRDTEGLVDRRIERAAEVRTLYVNV